MLGVAICSAAAPMSTRVAASAGSAVTTSEVWASVSTGGEHVSVGASTCAVRVDGSLWCWGNNSDGQLGLGDVTNRSQPFQVGGDTDWAAVGVGDYHACGIRRDHSVWCWGDNHLGSLGLGAGDLADRHVPTRVGTDADWASISLGAYHTCATRLDGSLWCWGYNFYGQLGLADTTLRSVPTQVGTDADWSSVSLGNVHTCATRTDRSLWCWGYNYRGQLGLGDHMDRHVPTEVTADLDWTRVAAGQVASCGIRADGSLWCWGQNQEGELGQGDQLERTVPTRVGSDTGWQGVSLGGYHSCAVRDDHTLWCWGANESGQLGTGDVVMRLLPGQIGGSATWYDASGGGKYTCSPRLDHTLWCWGSPQDGELGVGTRTDHHYRPTQVGLPNPEQPVSHVLAAVDSVSATDAWAVGHSQTGKKSKTFVEHWDGVAWTVTPSPSPGGAGAGIHVSVLTGVTAIAPDDVWAVGYYNNGGDGYTYRTLTEHWDGTTWTQVPSPNGDPYFGSYLTAVSAASPVDIWAVGHFYLSDELGPDTLVEHWDGTGWTIVPSQDPGHAESDVLEGVSAVASDDVWAVGHYDHYAHRPLTEHWTGATWRAVASPHPRGRVDAVLHAVSATSAFDAWAVGANRGPDRTLVDHWDGEQWIRVGSPSPGRANGSALTGVSAESPTNAWAVGSFNDGERDRTLVEHWDGTEWRRVHSPSPGLTQGNYLTAVTAQAPTDAWAVGYFQDGEQTRALIEHWDGTRWSRS